APYAGHRLGESERAGLARWRRQRDLADAVGHGLTLHGDIVSVHQDAQRLFFEVWLLHRPVREPPQQVEVRSAALVAARPQPDVVGEKERHAAPALARAHPERTAARASEHGGGG